MTILYFSAAGVLCEGAEDDIVAYESQYSNDDEDDDNVCVLESEAVSWKYRSEGSLL